MLCPTITATLGQNFLSESRKHTRAHFLMMLWSNGAHFLNDPACLYARRSNYDSRCPPARPLSLLVSWHTKWGRRPACRPRSAAAPANDAVRQKKNSRLQALNGRDSQVGRQKYVFVSSRACKRARDWGRLDDYLCC